MHQTLQKQKSRYKLKLNRMSFPIWILLFSSPLFSVVSKLSRECTVFYWRSVVHELYYSWSVTLRRRRGIIMILASILEYSLRVRQWILTTTQWGVGATLVLQIRHGLSAVDLASEYQSTWFRDIRFFPHTIWERYDLDLAYSKDANQQWNCQFSELEERLTQSVNIPIIVLWIK